MRDGSGGNATGGQDRDWRTASEKRSPDDPDFYWADPETGELKCNRHCLWEEIK